MKVTKTTETYNVSVYSGIIYIILEAIFVITLLSLFYTIFLCWLSYHEYKEFKDLKKLTYEHNGTCYKDGFDVICSYQGDKTTIITSTSKCYRNNIEINCSEIEK